MELCFERQINAFLWISLISVTGYLLEKLADVFRMWAKARKIPGPPCPSFFGHYHLISRSNLTDVLYNCHKKYGGVVKLWLGPTHLLVSVMDQELTKEVLVKAEDKLPLTGKAFSLAFGKSSLFVSSFDKVEHRRNSLETQLNGTVLQRVSLIPSGILECILERSQNAMPRGGLDCETVSQHLAFSILGATLFGDVFLTWPNASAYEELLMKIAKDACFWASYSVTPFWKQEFWRYQDLCAKLKGLTQELVRESKQHNKSVFYWDLCSHHEMGYEPCGEIISMLFHGSLTMAALISNILTMLVAHPDIQNKIHSEVITATALDSLTRHNQLNVNRLPHLLATIYESARLLPAGPFLQRCSLRHDLNLKNGAEIPAATIILVPVQLVQMDRLNWGDDAREFNPHRFLSRNGDGCRLSDKEHFSGGEPCSCVMKEPSEYEAFLPFGSGARACVGQKLAIRGVSSLFAALVRSYEVKLQPGFKINPKPVLNNCVQQLLPSPKILLVRRGG